MTALHRKLRRDLLHLRGQVAAIGVVVACGVATVITTRTAYDSLVLSQTSYYTRYRFADVFVHLKRAPAALAAELERIPGAAVVQTRLVFDVALDVPGLPEPATGRLISIPERDTPLLNDLYIRRGRYIAPGQRDEVMVSEAFAQANRLAVGDMLGAILNGRWQTLRVVGVALSPEYVYEIRGTEVFPDNRRFGVLWMSRASMGPAFNMEGAFNDVAVSLAPRASEPEVIAHLDRLLEAYGGLGAYGRNEQLSARFLADEIAQNRVSGTIVPAIFLLVAAFLLNIVLSRLVSMQRDQIAVLKAFGYSHRAVALHYLQFALCAVFLGAVAGTGLGIWLGYVINRTYVQFYRFPILRYEVGIGVVMAAGAVSGGAALLGALRAVYHVLSLPAAEAMRPEAPAHFHRGLLDRIGLQRRLSVPVRMILRNIARRPARAVLSTVGIALAVAILIVGRYFVDAIEHIAMVQFEMVHRHDVTISFTDPLSSRARHSIEHLPGVMRSEAFRVVPARLRFAHRARRVPLMGLAADSELYRLIDRRLLAVDVPPAGVLLTTKLASILGVGPGDTVTVEVLEGARPSRNVTVAGTVDELIGMSAYMEMGVLNQFMREGGTVSGAFLSVDPAQLPRLYSVLKQIPAVAAVAVRKAARLSFEETLAKSLGIFTLVLVGFACVIAIAMVYNAARVALSERGRELASLRVLGFTRAEVALMLLGEQAMLTVAAVPLGYAIGFRTCALIAGAYQWELFRLPLVVTARTYVFGFAVVLAASLFSALLVRRRLDRLDLVEVLKTRE